MNISQLLRLILLFLLSCARISFAIDLKTELENALVDCNSQFRFIESLEFTSDSKIDVRGTPDGIPPLKKHLSYRAQGDKFAFAFEQSGGQPPKVITVNAAFDGKNYQIRSPAVLQIKKGFPLYVPAFVNTDAFFLPFEFLKLSRKTDGLVPANVGTIPEFRNYEHWKELIIGARKIESETTGNDRCIVVTLNGMDFGAQVETKVWLSLAHGGFPIRWQRRAVGVDGVEGMDYEITSLELLQTPKGKIYYPKTAVMRQYCGQAEPCATTTIQLSRLQVNGAMEEDSFTFDPSSFDYIVDLDSGVTIPVPK